MSDRTRTESEGTPREPVSSASQPAGPAPAAPRTSRWRWVWIILGIMSLPIVEPLLVSAIVATVPGADKVASVTYPQKLKDRVAEVPRPSLQRAEEMYAGARAKGWPTTLLFFAGLAAIAYVVVNHLIPAYLMCGRDIGGWIATSFAFLGCLVWINTAAWGIGSVAGIEHRPAVPYLPSYEDAQGAVRWLTDVIAAWPDIDTVIFGINLGWFDFLLPFHAAMLSFFVIMCSAFMMLSAFSLLGINWKTLLDARRKRLGKDGGAKPPEHAKPPE